MSDAREKLRGDGSRTDENKVLLLAVEAEKLQTAATLKIDTRTPIQMLHFTLQPGGTLAQSVPAEQNGLVYVFKGTAWVGAEKRTVREGQAALLGSGDAVTLGTATDAAEPAANPVAVGPAIERASRTLRSVRDEYREQIKQAFTDCREGRFGEG